jgi:hypothetical protein
MKKAQLSFLALIAAEVNEISVCLEGIMSALELLAVVEDADERR